MQRLGRHHHRQFHHLPASPQAIEKRSIMEVAAADLAQDTDCLQINLDFDLGVLMNLVEIMIGAPPLH